MSSSSVKRSLEADLVPDTDPDIKEPLAKRERPTEYYQYVLHYKEVGGPSFNNVSLLDMASPGASEAHSLLQQRIKLGGDTVHCMLWAMQGYYENKDYEDEWPLAAELKALKDKGSWEVFDTDEEDAQGHRGIVYYLYAFVQ